MTQWQPEGDPRRQQPDPWAASNPGQSQQPGPQGYVPPPQGYYQPQYAPPPQQRPRRARKGIGIGCLGLVVLVILIAVIAGSHSSTPAALPTLPTQSAVPAQTVAAAKPAAAQTVTYVVTGSAADVTYGPTGSDTAGTVPMHVTKPLGTPLYYSISAQLQGGGTVSCKIEVDGKVISQATASGGYNLADCEISKDPLSGQWTDTNGNS
jgi:hypothetical protein